MAEGDVLQIVGGHQAFAAGGGGGGGTLAEVLADGNDTGGVAGFSDTAIVSVVDDPSGGGLKANVSVSATATSLADAYADRTATTESGDAHARTIVTSTGIQDALATTAATTQGGNADASVSASTDTRGGNAHADRSAVADGNSSARSVATATTDGTASVDSEADTVDGTANTDAFALATGDGNAHSINTADTRGAGLATAGIIAYGTGGVALRTVQSGLVAVADATSARMGFNGVTPVAKPTGVAVSAAGIHAALVSLGLIEP